jgi:hypothetical protein
MTEKQKLFVKETLEALKNKARIGKEHYTVTITRIELDEIIQEMEKE